VVHFKICHESLTVMNREITFTRFLFLDTNILRFVTEDTSKWRPLQDFLHAHDLCLTLSDSLLAELCDVVQIHDDLNTLLTSVPCVITKGYDVIFEEELACYPSPRSQSLVSHYLNAEFGTTFLRQVLTNRDLKKSRELMKAVSLNIGDRILPLKPNFPLGKSGKYEVEQASLFAFAYVAQTLGASHSEFLRRFQQDAGSLQTEVFKSDSLLAYVIYYKYYLHRKNPLPTDLGDLMHVPILPYCRLVVVERELCNVLNHIKSNHDVLKGVSVRNVDFLKQWDWEEEM
jgi:AraC-like DNA-binding protein